MLKFGLGLANKASAPERKGANGLGERAFNACPSRIALIKRRRALVDSGLLKGLLFFLSRLKAEAARA